MSSEKEKKYSIAPINGSDKDRVIDFLNRFFLRDEPLRESLGLLRNPEDRCKELEDHSMSSLMYGLSLMAVNEDGDIIGICLNKVFTREKDSKKTLNHDKNIEACENAELRKLWRLLNKVYWEADVFGKSPDVDAVLGLDVLSVDASYRGQGIAEDLTEKTIALAKQRGFPLVSADCNSAYSAKVMVRLGFQLVYSLPYSEYLDSQGHPVFTPKAPHTAMQTFVKRVD